MPKAARFGFTRHTVVVNAPIASGTSLQEWLTDLVLGFGFEVEKVSVAVKVAATGAGATRLFRVVKGASTVVASKTIALADATPIGKVIDLTMASTVGDRSFDDDDTLTVDSPAADSVSFTAGELEFYITYLQRPQAKD